MLMSDSDRGPKTLPNEPAPARLDRAPTDTLYAFYDLAVSPTSYDFAVFLARAALARRAQGLGAFRAVIVPASGDGFWDREPHPPARKRLRLHNLLAPLCTLWPDSLGATLCESRDAAERILGEEARSVFPEGYALARPVEDAYQWAHLIAAHQCGEAIPAWRAPERARSEVAGWLDRHARGRAVVTITLRESDVYPEINSDLAAWGAFARALDSEQYVPVILRDTEADAAFMPAELSGLALFEGASKVALRAALYEAAWLNMGTASGPLTLCWLRPDLPYLVFRMFRLGSRRSTPTAVRALGLKIGGQLATAGACQRIVWEDETPDAIARAFEAMARALETPGARARSPAPALEHGEPPLATARRLRETGRLEPARRIYKHEIRRGPSKAAAWLGLSVLELETPRPARLARYLRAGLALLRGGMLAPRPDRLGTAEALEIADAYRRWRFFGRARLIYRKILERNPRCAAAWHGLGALAARAGALEAAADRIGRAVTLEPTRARFHRDLADALAGLGRTGEAAEHYRLAALSDLSDEVAARRYEALSGIPLRFLG